MLERQFLTLVVTLATFAATIWLYLIIPKGFLPLQDTGLVYGVMEGGQDVSFIEMQRLSGEVERVIRQDPDVTGVVSVIGVTPLNATPECRPARHHAAPARRARRHRHGQSSTD